MELQNVTLSDDERQKCEIWTRVMGYYRPVENYNKGKQAEYRERKCFKEVILDDSKTSTNECQSCKKVG